MNDADKRVYHGLRQRADWQQINNKAGGKPPGHHHFGRAGQGVRGRQLRRADLAGVHAPARPGGSAAGIRLAGRSVRSRLPGHRAKGGTQGDPFAAPGARCRGLRPVAPGARAPLPSGIQGPMDAFGESYAVYTVDLLESKMKAMHKSFRGVIVEHREDGTRTQGRAIEKGTHRTASTALESATSSVRRPEPWMGSVDRRGSRRPALSRCLCLLCQHRE